MGFLKFFSRNGTNKLVTIPRGSFTVDRDGRIMTSTLPRTFPEKRLTEIGKRVVHAFRCAREADITLGELFIHFGALRIQARELRGGAMIFLTPQTLSTQSKT